ncbi:MAG: SLC13 family permease [Rhodocyclaceae bacterium]|nr:SLC13 family permease [Rhodocyclaceae bacterium]
MMIPELYWAPFVGLVLLVLLVAFVREWVKPDVAAMVAVAALLVAGVLSAKDVVSVFGNSAPITIACLFIISGALSRTGCVDKLGEWLGNIAGNSERRLVLAVMLTCLLVSPFINNTPVVMVMIPAVIAIASRNGFAPSRILIPLSYATILGGMITMVGTSTNILVDGVARAHGLAPFSMFEITAPATIMALAGLAFMALFSHRLLPVRETLTQQFAAGGDRWFITELFVPEGSHLVGKTLREARLSNGNIETLNLVRGDTEFSPPEGTQALQAGDRVVVRSHSSAMMELHSTDLVGLRASASRDHTDLETLRRRDVVMVEAIVGQTSRYLYRPIRDLDLLSRYGIHLMAVHRRDASFAQIGEDFELQGGDVLLVEGTPAQIKRFCENGDLFAITEGRQVTSRRNKAPVALAAMAGVMLLAALNVMPIEGLVVIGAALVIVTGCITSDEAYKSIEWPILVLIFGMLAISLAMRNSGLDQRLAAQLAHLGEGLSPWVMLSLVILLTSVATEFLSNNAIAVLITPVVIGLAQQMDVDPRPFVVGVMFAASCSFATPIGYQTNTLVYSAGNYRFSDFLPLGIPLNLIYWLMSSALIPLFWPF